MISEYEIKKLCKKCLGTGVNIKDSKLITCITCKGTGYEN